MFVTCNSSNIQTWMVASFSVSARFMAKMWVGFGLNPGKRFFWGFILKPTERQWALLKNVLGIFKIALLLRNRYVFMWQSLKTLNVFDTLTLKEIF